MIQKNSKNVHVLIQIKPYNSTTYDTGNGKHKIQTHLSRNDNFVFTNLLKNAAEHRGIGLIVNTLM